jgi:hypothetical protein
VTETLAAHDGRSRPWWVDALVGGGLALALITAAHAALPRIEPAAAPVRATSPAPQLAAAPAAAPDLVAFQTPAPGYPVISPFGLRQLPWEEAGRLHAGVDIAAPAGEPVLAAADGVVTRMAVDGGYGRFVEVRHAAGLSTIYAHLGRFRPEVTEGLTVKAGTPLGEIGSTGTSTGSHVHFEIRDDKGRPLNPELFLGHRFAQAEDLPLRAAARVPRQLRVAYVSNIPQAKREEMAARIEEETAFSAAEAASDAAAQASDATASDIAPKPDGAAVVTKDAAPRMRLAHGRPRARFRIRN